MYSERNVLELIDLIYKAAGDPNAWPKLLQELARALDADACSVHHHQIPSQESNFSADWNVDPACISGYTAYYGARNIWRSFRPHLFTTGSVNVSQQLCPEQVFRRSEYYSDFLRFYNLYHCLVATLRDDSTAFSNLTIFRPESHEGFGDEESRLLRLLTPHLVRAFELHNRIQGLEKKANALEQTLGRIQTAVVLLDSSGRVLFVNKSATTLFHGQKHIRPSPTGLQVTRTPEHRQLTHLIQGAIKAGMSIAGSSGGVMNISRSSFQRPLQVLVSPLKTETLSLGRAVPRVIVFISDPDRSPRMPGQWLKELYGLTPAEARLSQLLASGCDLKDSSERLQVSASTVRSQLKSIFAKTGTNRQSELMRVLVMGTVQLVDGVESQPLDARPLRSSNDKV
jgi:DNA-binding CsgD family transcriptional regulator